MPDFVDRLLIAASSLPAVGRLAAWLDAYRHVDMSLAEIIEHDIRRVSEKTECDFNPSTSDDADCDRAVVEQVVRAAE